MLGWIQLSSLAQGWDKGTQNEKTAVSGLLIRLGLFLHQDPYYLLSHLPLDRWSVLTQNSRAVHVCIALTDHCNGLQLASAAGTSVLK
jgi:hypothetical protein